MGLLDSEAYGKIASMIDPDTPQVEAETSAPQEAASEPNEATADAPQDQSAATSDATEDVKDSVEVEASDDGDQEHSHHVPYNRFKQVLDARNSHKSEVEQLRQEMAQLREQMNSAPQQSSDDDGDYLGGSDLDDLLYDYDDDGVSGSPDVGPHMSELVKRIEHFEVYQAEQELQREVAEAKETYPHVPDDVIYQAVARDPSASVMQIAEQYSAFVGGIEEAAIARYMKEHNMQAPQAEAPPRPARSGAPPLRAASTDKAPPKNLEEAKKSLREYLKTNNIFNR